MRKFMKGILICSLVVFMTGCSNKIEEDDTLPLPPIQQDNQDISQYEGIWLCGSQYDYDYLKIDLAGNFELYQGNEVVVTGYLQYEPEWDCIYAYDDIDQSGCQFRLEGDELYIGSYGYFTKAEGMVDITYE